MSTRTSGKTGVVLMTYGSATTAEHVEEYFKRIYKGAASAALIRDFKNRYRAVGRSPLIDITNAQAVALEKELGKKYVVRAGMRHSPPFIEEAIATCRAAGASSLVGIILSPQFSSFIMKGYTTAFKEAAERAGFVADNTVLAEPWPTEEHFIEFLAKQTRHAHTLLTKKYKAPVPIIFTTHSLPRRVVDHDPRYLKQLKETVDAIRTRLGPGVRWYTAYQSAGHTPEEWLKPDLLDVLAEVKEEEASAALIVPIQFVADHLEILYDLDIAARKQCEQLELAYHRTLLPNTDPLFILSLSAITRHTAKKL